MSTLCERLDRIRAGFLAKASEDVKGVMARATDELRGSGILDRMPATGTLMQPFELPDSDGRVVRSADLLERGPLVVSFYRGSW